MSATLARLAIAAAIGSLSLATPALAAKPKVVRMPAAAIKSPTERICMPRKTSPIVGKDKSLPATLCQTMAQWEVHGVKIVTY